MPNVIIFTYRVNNFIIKMYLIRVNNIGKARAAKLYITFPAYPTFYGMSVEDRIVRRIFSQLLFLGGGKPP
jgi:hypothetical protein